MKLGIGVTAFLAACVFCLSSAAAEKASPEELEKLFREGMQALETGRLKQAQELFQTILSMEPSLHRARLELAVAYYRALNYEKARELAETVLRDPQTPPEVRVTINAFLAQVEADSRRLAQKHQWRGSLAVGAMHDTNVNVGPSSEFITSEIRLLPGFTARSDNAGTITGVLSHTWNTGKRMDVGQRTGMLLWQSQLGLYHREYNHEDAFNLSVASLSTGPAIVVPGFWRGKINLRLDDIYLGGSHLALLTAIEPLATWQLGDTEVTVDASLGDRDYRDDADGGREGAERKAGVSLAQYFMNRRLAVQAGLRWHDFNADDDQWGYDGPEVYLGAQTRAWKNGLLYARVAQRDFEYDAVFPGFTQARDDRTREFTAGFRHDFRGGHLDKWQVRGSVLRIINGSNLGIFRYDRTQLQLTIGRDFQ